MVLVSLDRITEPYLDPDTNVVDALVYRGKGLDVDTVIVDGEVVLRGGKLTRVNKDEIVARLKESLGAPRKPHEVHRAELGRRLLPHVQRFFEGWELGERTPHYLYNQRT